MHQTGDRLVKWTLMTLAFTALTSLLLIAIFIFKDRHIETAGDSVPPITILADRFTLTR